MFFMQQCIQNIWVQFPLGNHAFSVSITRKTPSINWIFLKNIIFVNIFKKIMYLFYWKYNKYIENGDNSSQGEDEIL